MTTSKVIISSTEPVDRNLLRGSQGLASAAVTALIMFGLFNLLGMHDISLMVGGVSILTSIVMNWFGYRKYAKQRADFILSISEAVKRETGYEMSPQSIMNFLISGKADDDKGNSLRIERTPEALNILLISEPVNVSS